MSRGKLAMESNPAKESRRESDGLVAPEGGNKQPKASKRRRTGVTKSAKKMLCRIPKHGRNGNIPSVMVKVSHVKSIAMFRTYTVTALVHCSAVIRG